MNSSKLRAETMFELIEEPQLFWSGCVLMIAYGAPTEVFPFEKISFNGLIHFAIHAYVTSRGASSVSTLHISGRLQVNMDHRYRWLYSKVLSHVIASNLRRTAQDRWCIHDASLFGIDKIV